MAELTKATGDLKTLLSELQNPRRRELATSAMQGVEAYAETFANIRNTITQRNTIRSELDSIGPETQAEVIETLTFISGEQADIGETSRMTANIALLLISALALGSLGFGWVTANRSRRTIATHINASLETMDSLAEGQLDVEISGAADDTEIGRIAQALTKFRDNAVEAKRVEAEQEKQKELLREKEIADAEQRKADEAETARKMEAARKATMQELASSIGDVVRAGANGEFDKRINATFEDPELREMADMINTLISNVETGVNDVADIMVLLAEGNFEKQMSGSYRGKFAELKTSVNSMVLKLSALVNDVSNECRDVSENSGQMSDNSQNLSKGAETQAASLEEASAAMEEIAASVNENLKGASTSSEYAKSTVDQARKAGQSVENAVTAMGDIQVASGKITEIVSVMDGIAFQTNLLALNAGVEAARAGDAGRGFAVVASEVRALAQRAGEASKDINTLINESSTQVTRGVELVEETGKTLSEVVEQIGTLANNMAAIHQSAQEQATSVGEVTNTISHLAGQTQQTAMLADQSNDAVTNMKSRLSNMLSSLAAFRTFKHADSTEHEDLTQAAATA